VIDRRWKVAVVGATGVVGTELVRALSDGGHPPDQLLLLASERSAGEELPCGDQTLEVERVRTGVFKGLDLVFFATPPDTSRLLSAAAESAGARVVDTSRAFLSDLTTPVGFPGLAAGLQRLPGARRARVPGPVSQVLLTTLEPLRARFGVQQVSVSALLSASGAGRQGISELEQQTASLLSGRELEASHFPHRLAFNLVPQVGPFSEGSGATLEELSWRAETGLLWGRASPQIDGTAVWVPTFHGHLVLLTIRLGKPAEPAEVREALKAGAGLKIIDAPVERIYPMPMLVTSDEAVHVGRIRAFAGSQDTVELVAAIDNAGATARLCVEVAEQMGAPAAAN